MKCSKVELPRSSWLQNWMVVLQIRRLTALNMALAGLEAAIAALNSLRDPKDGDPSSSKLLLDMISTIPADTVLDTLDKISTRLDVTEAKVAFFSMTWREMTDGEVLERASQLHYFLSSHGFVVSCIWQYCRHNNPPTYAIGYVQMRRLYCYECINICIICLLSFAI